MTAEGVFPKVAGDIAYASEANNFHTSSHLVYSGTNVWITSGTDLVSTGSYNLTGKLTNPCYIDVYASVDTFNINAGSHVGLRVNLSGTQGNLILDYNINASTETGFVAYMPCRFIVGSPMPFSNKGIAIVNSTPAAPSATRTASDAGSQIWSNGSLVVHFAAITTAAGSAVTNSFVSVGGFY